ncbi:transmembrane amino acid transporter protein [Cercophora newfieldiana]|uniref:Transmembrane amino acid transporter protein n=1 Tax=Cercophora newfieldiana TaxID=92897 RepID=A0AA39Y1L9_9PEZI|nr:transmembrane amino acid transporter protein [Cercophora newfieldiana]
MGTNSEADHRHQTPDALLRPTLNSNFGIKPQQRKLRDPTVTFEEYHYYAQQTRAAEASHPHPGLDVASEKQGSLAVSDEEWANESRALRTATRGAIFYLITTGVLGPFGLPYAFATMGRGPGIALYTVFAGLAGYSGYLLWEMFMGLDSYQYPVRTFGDLGYRLVGPWMRHLFMILQTIQLFLNVGLIIISNGEALSQAAKFRLCFIVCCVVWAIIGLFIGQIRTLQKFGWLANAAVWINLICMFITMGAAAHTSPNFADASQSAGAVIDGGILVTPGANGVFPPVTTSGRLPATDGGFTGSVSGAMQAIFAYGGSMIFPEFMAEIKRPKDFLTAMWAAQAFIYFWYMFYSLFIYLGIGSYNLQTAGNAFAMVSTIIAAALYGNIGVKVLYETILVDWFRAPPLTTRSGKFLWAAIIPVYWAIAFVIAAAIPNFPGLISVIAAFCILQFTYSFPPLLSLAYWAHKQAMVDGGGYDPATGPTARREGQFKRLVRGLFGRRWWWNLLNLVYFLGALALAGLGAYSEIQVLREAFANNTTTSFTCKSPLDG